MKKHAKIFLSSFLTLMLIAAACLALTSCEEAPEGGSSSPSSNGSSVSDASAEETPSDAEGPVSVGEGDIEFLFTVTFLDGSTEEYSVFTDKQYVGEALQDAGLISGTQGQYGLYVDTVCGEKHVFEDDGKYWAFYIDGEYAMTGVDLTEVAAGTLYEFKAE